MPTCKNDPTSTYSGKEPSPKGLGWCAHSETIGKKRRGNDGEMWIVAKRSSSTLYWKKWKPDTKKKSNLSLSKFFTLPKENWKKWEKELPGLHQFRKFKSLLEKHHIPLKILILPVIWKNRDNVFNSIPYRDALIANYPQLKTEPSLVVYLDLDKNRNLKTSDSFTHYFNFTPEIEKSFFALIRKYKKTKTRDFLVLGSIMHKISGKIMKRNSTWLKPETIAKLKSKYPFTRIRKDPYFIVNFFGKLPTSKLFKEGVLMYMYDKKNA